MRNRDAKRVLVITDKTLSNAGVVPLVETTLRELTDAAHQIFDDTESTPTTNCVRRAANAATAFQSDLIVGLGGGTVMDIAKAARIIAANDAEPSEMFGFDQISGDGIPLVCIPTTAGSGSEMSHAVFLQEDEHSKKQLAISGHLRPEAAIVDPYLTVTCPSRITAEGGWAALVHAIEAFLATNFYTIDQQPGTHVPFEGNNPFGDMLVEKSIRLIGQHLQRATVEPEDLAARTGMSLAATLAGSAFANCGPGLVHSLAISVAGDATASYGAAAAVFLPHALQGLIPDRITRIAKIGELLNNEPLGLPPDEAADWTIQRITDLRAELGLPAQLDQIGIAEPDFDSIARQAASIRQLTGLASERSHTCQLDLLHMSQRSI